MNEDGDKITTAQWLQLTFLRKILRKRYSDKSRLVGDTIGDEFFRRLSSYVRNPEEDEVPRFDEYRGLLKRWAQGIERRLSGEIDADDELAELELRGAAIPKGLADILDKPEFRACYELFSDKNIRELMRIPYPAKTEEFVRAELAESEEVQVPVSDEMVIKMVIAAALGKRVKDLTITGLERVRKLDLEFKSISDIGLLRYLTDLKMLDLSGTQVSSIKPLKGLTMLSVLNLEGTQVSDIQPLKGLTNLSSLFLGGTKVSDIEPLKGLTNLSSLFLGGTQVSDIVPLKELTNLSVLGLASTQVSDLEPLKGLTNLSELYLHNTKVRDIEPLKGLTNLSELYLYDTQISDIEPLKGLTNLSELSLSRTQVSDIGPLKESTNLSKLYLGNTKVNDIEPLKGLTSLSSLVLSGTQVNDEQVESLQRALPDLSIDR